MPEQDLRFKEPLTRTLARNGTLVVSVAVVVALVRQDVGTFLPAAVLALWPTLGGHYVELAFLNGLRARIPQGRAAQTVVRVLVWAIGGVLLYLCMAATSRALPMTALPLEQWWYGVLFIGVELVAHGAMAIRGLPSVFDGRG